MYEAGVTSEFDERFNATFQNVYTHPGFNTRWYQTLSPSPSPLLLSLSPFPSPPLLPLLLLLFLLFPLYSEGGGRRAEGASFSLKCLFTGSYFSKFPLSMEI